MSLFRRRKVAIPEIELHMHMTSHGEEYQVSSIVWSIDDLDRTIHITLRLPATMSQWPYVTDIPASMP